MADQTRKGKPKKEEEEAQVEETTKAESKTSDIDELLDEIDEVLEVNSEEFVRSYVQKGGELVLPIGLLTMESNELMMVAFVVAFMLYGWRMWSRVRR